ncbi:DEAD/DEAH box helicase [Mangrovibrevibacter kandeliae]|uniref:DEAD/DEAH box helicase n=1 Tax=Mangrovibrevibacter kandeliae TaxID=2968473 RepID=UPI00211865FE|nr:MULTISPECIES: DEAD/DEAH box helicase [unclassified Aurantimonas]MCQ8782711.1 DEAD/DEAH box helicase [Aurantimonas sp. CSK15Z-1]MCW4114481.1 DEAD/DEAH box helicase [Aurantimonas sp. MSK8Z-1]
MTSSTFQTLGLSDALLAALARMDLTTPTPIQAQAIPAVLKGRDVLAIAQTGTGKTAAFSLPVIDALLKLDKRPRPTAVHALVLAPTRELAIQIAETVKSLTAGTKLRHQTVFGGVSARPQMDALRSGLDIVIATPGRLLDLMEQKAVTLADVRHVVLDEADRMLDMGFIRDITRIVKALPSQRQSLLFSATMPQSVGSLVAKILKDPVRVEVTPEVITVEKIDQRIVGIPQKAKKGWLIRALREPAYEKVVIFTRTKHGANKLAADLEKAGIAALPIHGNKSQGARQKALGEFHSGKTAVLVATDIVARGIHVDDISHVVNYDLPEEPENYVHRIGRTARAGRSGIAVALVDPSERPKLKAIERFTRQRFEIEDANVTAEMMAGPAEEPRPPRPPRNARPAAARPQGTSAARGGAGAPAAGKPAGASRRGRRSRGRGRPAAAAAGA